MTTFKTPLPEKIGNKPAQDDDSNLVYEVMIAVDQIIDYLKEREVVENPNGCSPRNATTPHYMLGQPEEPTPSLKEQLLGEIKAHRNDVYNRRDTTDYYCDTYGNALDEVEAIIERIIK